MLDQLLIFMQTSLEAICTTNQISNQSIREKYKRNKTHLTDTNYYNEEFNMRKTFRLQELVQT